MAHFAKLVNGFQLLTTFTKGSILDVCQGSKYAIIVDVFVTHEIDFCVTVDTEVCPIRKLSKL